MTRPAVITETIGGSPLSRAAQAGEFDARWYPPRPVGRAAWKEYTGAVAESVSRTWLADLHDAILPRESAAERLERAAKGGVVITTGQQPGLFGGATMILAKALSARAFADALEAHIGVPVAPVFWAATDDADFDEAAVVSIAGTAGAEILRLERSAPTGTPMARVPLGPDVDALAQRLRAACGSVADSRPLDAVLEAYRRGETVGGAYVTLLREILSPLGIGVVDASHPSVQRAASPLVRRALIKAEAIASSVRARTAEIVEAGFSPQVEEVPGLSLLFTNGDDGKRRLSLSETNDARVAAETLSSTVLLRPVMERSILPSAFYVGGPGEIAYFAQVSAVAEALGSPAPLVQPRWSVTIVEPRVQRHLDSLAVDRTVLRDPTALEGHIAHRRMPRDIGDALARLRDDARRDVDAMRSANDGLVSEAVVEGLERSLAHRLDRMERRMLAAVKRREADTMQLIAALRGALYPHGAPQERKLSYIPFLARYGSPLVEEMLTQASVHARSRIIEVPSRPTTHAPAASARA
jgi:bacillithiol biosynthesis cysteine-adding enzyme BshC